MRVNGLKRMNILTVCIKCQRKKISKRENILKLLILICSHAISIFWSMVLPYITQAKKKILIRIVLSAFLKDFVTLSFAMGMLNPACDACNSLLFHLSGSSSDVGCRTILSFEKVIWRTSKTSGNCLRNVFNSRWVVPLYFLVSTLVQKKSFWRSSARVRFGKIIHEINS